MAMNIYECADKKKISTRRILDFTVLTNPIGPCNKAKNAMRKALKSVSLHPDPKAGFLRRYIAKKERVAPESMVFGHGSTQLLDHLLAGVKPRRVLTPGPVPRHYERLVGKYGGETIPFPSLREDASSADAASVLAQIDHADMVLLPNPHTLTGEVTPLSVVLHLIDRAEGSKKPIAIDEALVEFTKADSPIERVVRSENALILRSFSLFHSLAGLPLGYALGGRNVLSRIAGPIDLGPVSALATAAAIVSLKDKGFYRRTEEFLKIEKSYLRGKLGRVASIRILDTPCNFLLLKIEKPFPELESLFLERNILVVRFEDVNGDSLIRLPVRGHRENARFAKTLVRMTASSGGEG
jgi:histidinol-phosphate/aromatic aminotransferase/cobyric acid decarboxylase-like protein